MYGGKFMPMHKGHLYCLQRASELCDKVYLLLVVGGKQEKEARHDEHRVYFRLITSEYERWEQVQRAAAMFDNVVPVKIDVSSCRDEDGEESWDMETPIVLNACGHFDAVFGSEPEYKKYFNRAYPWAEYVLIDKDRSVVPISATQIREMKIGEGKKWII